MAGGRPQSGGNLSSDLDYVRGIHSVRRDSLDFVSYHSDATSNYLGTYTFASLGRLRGGRAGQLHAPHRRPQRRSYRNLQSGVYVQDDIRVRRNLTLSPGVRYEVQSHVDDVGNVGPRFGVTWAPFKGGRTTLRASVGVFYDWLNTNTSSRRSASTASISRSSTSCLPHFPIREDR